MVGTEVPLLEIFLMLIKLYNGLNRFAPGLRLNFRYFSWIPDHSPVITTVDLLPFYGPALFLFVSHPPLLSLSLFFLSLCSVSFATLCSSPANPLILRGTRTSGWYRCRNSSTSSSHSRAHFCQLSNFTSQSILKVSFGQNYIHNIFSNSDPNNYYKKLFKIQK